MATDISEAVEQIIQERNISRELALQIVEDTILAAYKRKFGNSDNAVVRFDDEQNSFMIFARKKVVDGVYDPACEIELEDARKYDEGAVMDGEVLIELDPKEDFGLSDVQSAKMIARQNMRTMRNDSLYAEFKDKEGDIIIGYYQRERNGNIFVDLGKIEGILPKKFQSPREIYHVQDRIKALIFKVEKTPAGLSIVLSRTHTEFVKAIFEMEVPEVYDKTVEIHKIVREPGYRTKLAVFSPNRDVDPVAACVGPKGSRIQAVIRELEGEKIDILQFTNDPAEFIMNALSPADVKEVIILDEAKHNALAVVKEDQLSLAIGKGGQNVRLANRLVDWNIDVKTIEQYEAMDIYSASRRAVSRLFGEDEENFSRISELPGVDEALVEVLKANDIDYIEDFVNAGAEGRLASIEALSAEQIKGLRSLIDEHVIIEDEAPPSGGEGGGAAPEGSAGGAGGEVPAGVEGAASEVVAAGEPQVGGEAGETGEPPPETPEGEESAPGAPDAALEGESGAAGDVSGSESGEEDEGEEYECPECGAKITIDMTRCPNCGVELSFEDEEE